jgi:hypothetical protein
MGRLCHIAAFPIAVALNTERKTITYFAREES